MSWPRAPQPLRHELPSTPLKFEDPITASNTGPLSTCVNATDGAFRGASGVCLTMTLDPGQRRGPHQLLVGAVRSRGARSDSALMSLFYSSALGGRTDSVFKRLIAAKATKMKLHPRLGRRKGDPVRRGTRRTATAQSPMPR